MKILYLYYINNDQFLSNLLAFVFKILQNTTFVNLFRTLIGALDEKIIIVHENSNITNNLIETKKRST